MKKQILKILVLSSIFLISSCTGEHNDAEKNKKNFVTIKVSEIDKTKKVKFTELFDSVSFIPLQTTKECYLPNIEEVYLSDGIVVVKTSRVIYLFDRLGRYLNKIDNLGKGPREHEYISDINIDRKNKLIEFIDFYNLKLLRYDFECNFISKEHLPFFTDAFSKAGNNLYFLYTTDPNNETKFMLNLYDFDKHKIIKHFFPINVHYNSYLNFWHNTVFYCFDKATQFVINPFDTIYTIDTGGFRYRYVFDFGKHTIPKSFYDEDYSDIIDFAKKATIRNYAYNPDKFYETDNYLFFQFKYKNRYKRAFYNKNDEKVTVIKNFVDDINDSSSLINNFIWPIGQNGNQLIFLFEPAFLKEKYRNLNPGDSKRKRLLKLIDSLNVNDNPVLFVAHTK